MFAFKPFYAADIQGIIERKISSIVGDNPFLSPSEHTDMRGLYVLCPF